MGHTVFAHRNFDFHARVIDLPQHLHHTARRLAKQGGGFGQFNDHHLAGFGRARGAFGNQHVLAIALVFRCHQPNTTLLQQATNDGLPGAIQNFSDPPFRTTATVRAHNFDLHMVFVQHRPHFIGRQINIGLTIVTQNEAMAIAVALHHAFKFFLNRAGLFGGGCFFKVQSFAS